MWEIVKSRLRSKSFWILFLPIICMFLVDIGIVKSPEVLDKYFYKIWTALAFLGIVTNTTPSTNLQNTKTTLEPFSDEVSDIDDFLEE